MPKHGCHLATAETGPQFSEPRIGWPVPGPLDPGFWDLKERLHCRLLLSGEPKRAYSSRVATLHCETRADELRVSRDTHAHGTHAHSYTARIPPCAAGASMRCLPRRHPAAAAQRMRRHQAAAAQRMPRRRASAAPDCPYALHYCSISPDRRLQSHLTHHAASHLIASHMEPLRAHDTITLPLCHVLINWTNDSHDALCPSTSTLWWSWGTYFKTHILAHIHKSNTPSHFLAHRLSGVIETVRPIPHTAPFRGFPEGRRVQKDAWLP